MSADGLTVAMRATVQLAQSGDGCLYRWRGGFWTTVPQPPGTTGIRTPGRYTTWDSIERLVACKRAEILHTERRPGVIGDFATTIRVL